MRGANSPSTITNAINNNLGGMGYLQSRISGTDASNLAAYLATPNL
ncbi:hypothetical protein IMCC9480_3929 [Oxalobacteraceae bacterium IMCC9480]|nr:hypothetical protein IMCC9480_3929 [Oxalobacteraceae bacterium IMCC9480]